MEGQHSVAVLFAALVQCGGDSRGTLLSLLCYHEERVPRLYGNSIGWMSLIKKEKINTTLSQATTPTLVTATNYKLLRPRVNMKPHQNYEQPEAA